MKLTRTVWMRLKIHGNLKTDTQRFYCAIFCREWTIQHLNKWIFRAKSTVACAIIHEVQHQWIYSMLWVCVSMRILSELVWSWIIENIINTKKPLSDNRNFDMGQFYPEILFSAIALISCGIMTKQRQNWFFPLSVLFYRPLQRSLRPYLFDIEGMPSNVSHRQITANR